MSGVTIDVRRAPELDLESYAAFQKEAFRDLLAKRRASDRHMTAQFYRWKYRTPVGAARIATVRRAGAIVSSCAALPLRVSFGGGLVTGWHFVDVATLPVERGRGRFSSALRALADSIPTGDVLFAFPNEASIGGFRRLGFDENVVMTTWINLWPRLAPRATGSVRIIDRFGSDRDIAGMIDSGNRPCIDRRSDYLDWRYTDHPINSYSLSICDDGRRTGFSVTRSARVMDRDVVLIMELFGSTPRAQASLVAHAAERARSARVGVLVLMGTSVPMMSACRSWLVPVPSVLLPKRQVLVVRAGEHAPTSVVHDRWILRTGDWDVF
jgi:hypothetical protein